MALGATPNTVRRMVVWQGLKVVLVGAVVGVGVALASTQLLDARPLPLAAWCRARRPWIAGAIRGRDLARAHADQPVRDHQRRTLMCSSPYQARVEGTSATSRLDTPPSLIISRQPGVPSGD